MHCEVVPMKRKALWTVVGLVAIVLVVTAARADFRRGHGWCGNGLHRGGPLGHVAREQTGCNNAGWTGLAAPSRGSTTKPIAR